jgi:hypothetical protein
MSHDAGQRETSRTGQYDPPTGEGFPAAGKRVRVSSPVSSGDMRLSRPDEGHGQAPCVLDANGRRFSQLAIPSANPS